ncbi:acetylxylan esterase [Mucilaginibacter glaciei]|uniref:Acetylxylan esterase n=1 Tax=Mucilaginibacter glaciei TaxID=2772109 RepID=A0A926S2R0_9SPHI|nr:acetylxylan esterase [Mucilaginibacter glaciei]MBD1394122.1 acetylxylan esterase [Mucilaginibacter glaciei]
MKRILLYIVLALSFSAGVTTGALAQDDEKEGSTLPVGEVVIKTIPGKKNAIFSDNGDVDYKLKVNNLYQIPQDGDFSYRVRNDLGVQVYEKREKFSIGKNSVKTISVKVPKQKAGFYNIDFRFNLTEYDDTVRRTFGVDPEKLKSPLSKPADFDAFWAKARKELSTIKPDYKVTLQKELSDNNRKVYLVEMRSYRNLIIRGWLVVPKESYKQPVHYRLPGYVVGLNPNFDTNHFITFNLNVRGNGNSQDVINLGTDDYATAGIEHKDSTIYKGVYLDCLRGADFLFSHPELGLDTSKIFVEGSSQGGTLAVITAAMDKRFKGLAIQVPLYANFRLDKEIGLKYDTPEFPIKFFNRYLDKHPNMTWEKIFSVMDYYDPQNFAQMVKCPVIMGIGLLDKYCPPRCSFSMFNQFGSKSKEWFTSPELTHEVAFDYYMLQNVWLGEQFRLVN